MTNTQRSGQQADRQARRVFLLLPRIDVSVTVMESDNELIPTALSFLSAASFFIRCPPALRRRYPL